jgi:alpha-amylase/alpha-mannosidase (GH57 family)
MHTRHAHLCLLLHMHQPQYRDPVSGRALLPWVRLHAVRGYLDVARLLDEHPRVRLTVNFVPSLIEQLEAVVRGEEDEWELLARASAGEPDAAQREAMLRRFFSIHWARAIEPRPRYKELLDKRGRDESHLAEAVRSFTVAELRDLAVLFNLAWIGFAAREGDAELTALEARGRDFGPDDLALVLAKQRAACARVLPLWRRLAERGQVELSTSPYYHPIVPLLVDSDHARRARPDLRQPDRYSWPADARLQIERGRDAHRATFGAPARGMWPPEGCLSPEAVRLYQAAGVGWLASDEGNLWRSFDLAGRGCGRGDLYRPWRFGGVDLVFRDRELSDRIGFQYAFGDAGAGVDDLFHRAAEAAACSTAPDGRPALVGVFLDGENPWESYPGSGEPFLRRLFARLSEGGAVSSATISEHLAAAGPGVELPTLHSGSWIDADFHIWIGDPVKNRAWDLLGRVRRRLERRRHDGATPEALAAAEERLLAAEGSDWFWWFGEPFHTAEKPIFDRLFREHLRGVLEALGEPAPDELQTPVSALGAVGGATRVQPPTALVRPRLGDARRAPSFYDWLGAGRYEVPRGSAMSETPLVERVRFGFDLATLFLRLELSALRAPEALGAALEIELEAEGLHLTLRSTGGRWQARRASDTDGTLAAGEAVWAGACAPRDEDRAARVPPAVSLAVPFAPLGLRPGATIALTFRFVKGGVTLGRYPADDVLELRLPDEDFEARNWSL